MEKELEKLYASLRAKVQTMNKSELSRLVGIHRTVLSRFASGKYASLNYRNTEKLKEYFDEK